MPETRSYNGLIVGGLFTGCSFLLSFNSFVPVVSVLPGAFFELLARQLIVNEPYSRVGELTIVLLALTLGLVLIWALFNVRKQALVKRSLSKAKVAGILAAAYFPVHALGFYIYWGSSLGFRSDGQLIFAAINSFPLSSFAFVVIGLLLDYTKITVVSNAVSTP